MFKKSYCQENWVKISPFLGKMQSKDLKTVRKNLNKAKSSEDSFKVRGLSSIPKLWVVTNFVSPLGTSIPIEPALMVMTWMLVL